MRFVDIGKVVISSNRQREEFDEVKLQELVTSIETVGLLHPPIVRSEGDQLVLVAGERRLRAIHQIFDLGGSFKHGLETVTGPLVPVTLLGELSQIERMEAEYEENISRADLTWQEKVKATEMLHKLRVAQNPEHRIWETAQELKGESTPAAVFEVREDLRVVQHLNNPLVAKAKDVKEAMKILRKVERDEENLELARIVGRESITALLSLYNVEAVEWCRGYTGLAFDVLCTDPPYGMGSHGFGDGAGRMVGIQHEYDDSPEAFRDLMIDWIPAVSKILKPASHVYQFCDFAWFPHLKMRWEAQGFKVFRTPLICHKVDSGRVPLPEHGPRRSYELILYAFRGDKRIQVIAPDVLSHRADPNEGHGAQKPVSLYVDILRRSCRPGDSVLDCFGGSGPILEAAANGQLRVTVLEKDPTTYGQALKRLQAITAQGVLNV